MSAFLGGVAQGFLQAKIRSEDAAAQAEKDRLQRLEAQKDRQMRLDIADKQIEMQRQQLLNQRKSANERKEIQIATAGYNEILRQNQTNPQGAFSGNLSPQTNQLVSKYYGIAPNQEGFYRLPTLYEDTQAAKQREGDEALAKQMIQNKVDPRGASVFSVQQVMRARGIKEADIKNVAKVRNFRDAVLIPAYFNKINIANKKDYVDKTKDPNPVSITIPNDPIIRFERGADYTNFDSQSRLTSLHNLTPQQKSDLSRNFKNSDYLAHGRVAIADHHLKKMLVSVGGDKNNPRYVAHAQRVALERKSDYLSIVANAKNKNNNFIHLYTETGHSSDQVSPDDYTLVKEAMKVKNNIPSSPSITGPMSIKKQEEALIQVNQEQE